MRRRSLFRCLVAVGVCLSALAVGISPALAATPKITSFIPISGPVGTSVTVHGKGFGGTTAVTFDNTAAAFTLDSGTQITATVPAGATTGPISVKTPAGLAISSSPFTVVPDPVITLSASNGPPGTSISVSGSGFDAQRAVDIYFDLTDEAVATTSVAGAISEITIVVPPSAPSGVHWVSAVERNTGLAAQAAFTVQVDWPQFHVGVTRKGANTQENALNPSNVSGIDEEWRFGTLAGVSSSPAIVDGVLYVGSSDHNVYALDASTGARIWSYTTGGAVTSSPSVVNGVVYVGSDDDSLYALDASTGVKLWSYATGGQLESAPAVADGFVYVGASNGSVYAVKAATGVLQWTSTVADVDPLVSPAVANGHVYVEGSFNGKIFALNFFTGILAWATTGIEYFNSTPAVANGRVIAAGENGLIVAIDAGTGAVLWTYAPPTTGFQSSPAVANGIVYVGADDHNLYSLKASTGAELWAYKTGGGIVSSPAVANGVVYVGSNDDNVYAVHAVGGYELWSYATGAAVSSSPAVVNGTVYVGSTDDNVYAFDLAGGTNQTRPNPSMLRLNRHLKVQGA